jgi:hypothetical protein
MVNGQAIGGQAMKDMNGIEIKVGSRVFFKADYEQEAEVVELLPNALFGPSITVTDWNGPMQAVLADSVEVVR